MFPKPPKTKKKSKNSPIRRSANGQECQVRLPGICKFTHGVVLGHLSGGGAAKKQPDFQAAYICSACHDVVDMRVWSEMPSELITIYFYQGIFRTQRLLVEQGFIEYQGI